MLKPHRKRSNKFGLPPGTPVHIGSERTDKVKITIIDYDEIQFHEEEAKSVEECIPLKDSQKVRWLNIDGIHQVEIIEKIGEQFGIHPLLLEDIVNTEQRPKIEDFGDYLFIVLKMLYPSERDNETKVDQISLILGSNFVISFQERKGDVFNPVRERLRNGKGRSRKMGADYLAYALMDSIVDSYFIVLEIVGEKTELLEEKLITSPTKETLQSIHKLKREMIFLRKSVWPLREALSYMERGESSLIKESTRMFLRDVYDHTIQIIDTIDIYRDIISEMFDIYLSSISNKMNEVMKVLTIIATIFMPLTFIAGIYGMNFKYMPELEWHFGYYAVLAFMAIIGISMLFYFRRRKWL